MNPMSNSVMIYRPHLTSLQKFVALGAWTVAGVAFMTIGWIVMAPDDPLGAVSLLTRRGAFLTLIQACALAGAVAAVATVLARHLLPDVGVFSAALGLGLVSLRGESAAYLLLLDVDGAAGFERILALKLMLEAIAWFLVIGVAVMVSAVVSHWLPASGVPDADQGDGAWTCCLAGHDVPRVGTRFRGDGPATDVPQGLKHAAIGAGVSWIALWLISSALTGRAVEHGQACFVVVLAVCVGSYFAFRMVPVRSALWSLIAVLLMTVVSYLWASVWGGSGKAPPNTPSSEFLRVLPIQYIGVGSATAVAMGWHMMGQMLSEENEN